MEPVKKSRRLIRRCTQKQLIQDVPEELIQHIQSLLPVKEAARTCVLSKSWLRAWSTIPTLRFNHQSKLKEADYIKLIKRTLRRYHRDNIPIVTFDLHFDVHGQKAVSLTDKWIRKVASKSCLKELYLTLSVEHKSSYTLPDEIFSCENLNTISVKLGYRHTSSSFTRGALQISNNKNVVINCINLRVIELRGLRISEEVLHKLFSTCTLLEKISLSFYNKYKTLKVKSLPFLRELRVSPFSGHGILEIYDLPSLHLFYFDSSFTLMSKRIWFNTDSLGSLRKLFLEGVVINNAFADIFKSNFPFLEILSLDIDRFKSKNLDITCASLQRLVIQLKENEQVNIQVCAPRLLFFRYPGKAMPRISFPIVDPDQIVLKLKLKDPVDHFFFLKIWETLNSISSNFKIKIDGSSSCLTLPFDINDLRIRIMSPATNVQKLTFDTRYLSKYCPLLDAFLSICHPKYVKAGNGMIFKVRSYLRKLIEREETHWPELKDVEVENCVKEKCGTRTTSWTSLLDRRTRYKDFFLFKLAWRSP